MENLALSFNVVAPLMVYILSGVILRSARVITIDACRQISKIVYYVATPALCLTSIMKSDFTGAFDDPFLLYLAAGVLLLFFAAMLVVPRLCGEPRRCGPLVQGIFRSNDDIFGLAVALELLGENNMGVMVLAIAMTVPLYNTLAVVAMEVFRGGKPSALTIVKRVATNPLILACLLGLLFAATNVRLPSFLDKSLVKIGDMCAPLGFLALGGSLTFASFAKNRKPLVAVTLVRLLVSPLVFCSLLYALGYRGAQMIVSLIIFGAPCAMATYSMACAMDGDDELAGVLVSVTSVLSIFTMFVFIFLLKQLGVA